MQQYVQDNGGTYPPGARCDGQDCFAQWPKAIFPYVKDVQVFRCPDNPQGNADPVDADYPLPRSSFAPTPGLDYWYNMIRLTTNLLPPPSASFQRGNHESSLSAPSTILLNTEIFWRDSDGGDHYFHKVTSSCGHGFDGNTLHSGGGNYSYVDGHVKWLTPEQAAEVECLNGPEARDYVFFQWNASVERGGSRLSSSSRPRPTLHTATSDEQAAPSTPGCRPSSPSPWPIASPCTSL